MGADRLISSGGPWEAKFGYSRAVVAGPFVLVSGCAAVVDGQVAHPGDAYAQAQVALGVIERALAEAGCTMADVVRTRIYLRHAHDSDAVGRAHGEAFAEVRPATAMIEVGGFVDPAMLVEIEADAYRG